jgi:hypothetical protein
MTLTGGRPRGRPRRDPNAPPKPSSERDLAIVAQYETGETLQAIGDRHGLSHQRIHQIMKAADVALRNITERRGAGRLKPRKIILA